MSPVVGGVGDSKKATPEVQAIVDSLKHDASTKLGETAPFSAFEAVSYKTQVVAGTNYFVKVRVGPSNEHIHVRVFKPLGNDPKPVLHSCQSGHTDSSEIVYF
jgi:cystatin-A/B